MRILRAMELWGLRSGCERVRNAFGRALFKTVLNLGCERRDGIGYTSSFSHCSFFISLTPRRQIS
jgi:hypothetical protein